jgi:hypothetical protein
MNNVYPDRGSQGPLLKLLHTKGAAIRLLVGNLENLEVERRETALSMINLRFKSKQLGAGQSKEGGF